MQNRDVPNSGSYRERDLLSDVWELVTTDSDTGTIMGMTIAAPMFAANFQFSPLEEALRFRDELSFGRLTTNVREGKLAEVERLLPEVKSQSDAKEKLDSRVLGHCRLFEHNQRGRIFNSNVNENDLNILRLLLSSGAKTVDGLNPILCLFTVPHELTDRPADRLFYPLQCINPIYLEAAKLLLANGTVPKILLEHVGSWTARAAYFCSDVVMKDIEEFYDLTNLMMWFIHLDSTRHYEQSNALEPGLIKPLQQRLADAQFRELGYNQEVMIGNSQEHIPVNFYKIYRELLNSFISSLDKATQQLWPTVMLFEIFGYVGYLGDMLPRLSVVDSPTFCQAMEGLKESGLFRRSNPYRNTHVVAPRTPTMRLMPPSTDDVD